MAKTSSKELLESIEKLNAAIAKITKGTHQCPPLVLVTDQKQIKKEEYGKR